MSAWPLGDFLNADLHFLEKIVSRPEAESWIAIAMTPRCGSTAFCSIIGQSKMLGRPKEILNPRGPAQWLIGDQSPSNFSQYLDIVAPKICTGTVCSFKTCWTDFEPLAQRSELQPFLSRLDWIYLDRRDFEKQALSLAAAKSTGIWHRKQGESAETGDFEVTRGRIDEARRVLKYEKLGWANYFKSNGINPPSFMYEDILQELQPAIDAIAKLAGVSGVPEMSWNDSKYQKLVKRSQAISNS